MARRARRFGLTLRTIALILTGLLLTIAYQQTVAAKPATNKAQKGLVADVRQRQTDTDNLERQAAALRLQVTKLRNAALNSSDVQHLTNLEAATGLGAVTGDGAIVTIASGPAPVNPVTNQPEGTYYGRVQDNDLQFLTNELWLEGAEAISINGQRLTATSTIRTAGNAILVDFRAAHRAVPDFRDRPEPRGQASRLANRTGIRGFRRRVRYAFHDRRA